MPLSYVTLYQLRAELGIKVDDTADDALLRRHLRAGGRWIDNQCFWRHFDPRRQTRRFSGDFQQVLLDDDLQEVLTLTNGDSTVVAASEYYLDPANQGPYWALTLNDFSAVSWKALPSGSFRRCLALDGVWFYHTDIAHAWADSLDVVGDNPLAADDTEITVADPDGAASDSDEPRFQVGNLIRLADDTNFEYCLIQAVTPKAYPDPGSLAVERGANGTTAQAWSADTQIDVFRPEETIQRALMRIATFTYRGKDGRPTERISVLGNTQQVVPGGIPSDVLDLLPIPAQVHG